jgi:PAS domain S-box-containing protein
MKDNIRILLIEDDPGDAFLIEEMLSTQEGFYQVYTVESLAQARRDLAAAHFQVILMDLDPPDSQGLRAMSALITQYRDIPIIVQTGLADEEVGKHAVNLGAQDYLVKGQFDGKLLIHAINYAIERKNTQRKIENAAREWRTTFDAIEDMIYVLDLDQKIVRCNNAAAEFLGKRPADLIGTSCCQLFHGYTKPIENCPFVRSRRTHKRAVATIKKNNRFFQVTTDPVFDAEGRLYRTTHIMSDITDCKQVEEKLQERQQFFQDIAESMGEWIWEIDTAGKFTFVTGKVEKMMGYAEQAILGKTPFDFMTAHEAERVQNIVQDLMKNTEPIVNLENRYLTKTGEHLCLITNGVPVFDNEGRLQGYRGVCKNITDRKQAEEALRESEERYRLLIESMHEGISMIDEQGVVTYINDQCCSILDYPKTDMLGKHWTTVLDEPARTIVAEQLQRQSKGADDPFEFEHVRKDGQHVIIRISPRSIFDDAGKFKGSMGLFQDITAQKQAEKDLLQIKKGLENAEEYAQLGSWELEVESGCGRWSKQMFRLFGFNPTDTVPGIEEYLERIHPEDRHLVQDVLRHMAEGQTPTSRVFRTNPDRLPLRYLSPTWRCIRDETGKPVKFEGTLLDVTERRRSEQITESRLKLLNLSAQCTADEVLQKTVDEAEALTDSQIGFYHFFKEDQKTLLLQVWSTNTLETFCKADPQKAHYPLDQAGVWVDCIRQRRAVIHNDYATLPHKRGMPKGHALIIRELIVPVFRREKIVAILGVGNKTADYTENDVQLVSQLADLAWDISERQRAEEALRASEGRHRTLFETMTTGVVYQDAQGVIISANPAAERILGLTLDQMQGRTAMDPRWRTIHEDGTDFPREEHPVTLALRTGHKFHGTIIGVFNPHENAYRWISITAIPLFRSGEKAPYQVYTTFEDITDRKQAQDALQHAKEELEQRVRERTQELEDANRALQQAKNDAEAASHAKSAFLANMSHDLRTPLNAIMGYSQMLTHAENLTEQQKKGMKTITHSGNHLLTLINDILDLSKIEAGRVEPTSNAFFLPEFLADIATMMQIRAQQQGLTFVQDFDPDLPAGVSADEKQLRQVLINLLGNAIKFTQEGRVTFRVTRLMRTAPNKHQSSIVNLQFNIEDTGIGIPEEHLEAIFEPFQQINGDKRHSTIEGTGLGLAISRQLVSLMGGRLQVESVLGKGSRFWFDLALPMAEYFTKQTAPSVRRITGYLGERRRILVVDDHQANRDVLSELLGSLGFEVFEAQHGQEGLELAARRQPDLIFLDLKMPVMDGMEASKAMRQHGIRAPIIAISANVFEESQHQAITAGCDDFITKPFQMERMLELLHSHLRLEWVSSVEQPEGSPDIVAPLRDEELAAIIAALPSEAADTLQTLAERGDRKKVLQQLETIDNLDARFQPLVNTLRTFAQKFDLDAIADIFEQVKKTGGN